MIAKARRIVPPGMLDANLRVRGRVAYTMDVSLPGMLHAKLLRSPYAHARVVAADVTRARALPAIGNAVFRATGVRITDLPITPEKLLRGRRARAAQESAE